MLTMLLCVAAITTASLLALSGLLHLLPRLGNPGRALSNWLTHAPGIDVLMTLYIALPLLTGPIVGGWAGLAGAIVGMYSTLAMWTWLHELFNRRHLGGPRIVKVNERIAGRFNTHAALWCMTPAVPIFYLVRLAQLITYPPLVWLTRLPPYRGADWVNVSRHKYTGLVGHDRVWCLYCDWMTGVWSLGSEMLRNVESFWCPIRFRSDLKCENCKIDFPDIDHWSPKDGSVADAVAVLQQRYESDRPPHNSWFGHPARLTVRGQVMDQRG